MRGKRGRAAGDPRVPERLRGGPPAGASGGKQSLLAKSFGTGDRVNARSRSGVGKVHREASRVRAAPRESNRAAEGYELHVSPMCTARARAERSDRARNAPTFRKNGVSALRVGCRGAWPAPSNGVHRDDWPHAVSRRLAARRGRRRRRALRAHTASRGARRSLRRARARCRAPTQNRSARWSRSSRHAREASERRR